MVNFGSTLSSLRGNWIQDKRVPNNFLSCPPLASSLKLKIFYCYLVTSQQFALGDTWPCDFLEMGCLFAFHAAGGLVCDQQQSRRNQQAGNIILEVFVLSMSEENTPLRRCYCFNSISLKGYEWERLYLFQNDKITCL